MIPLKDNNPTSRFPYVTVGLILANVGVFLWEWLFFAGGEGTAAGRLGLVPYELTHLVQREPPSLVPVPMTLLSSMFLHGSLVHLGGNMLYLWIFGNNVEETLGRIRFLLFYCFTGLAAAATHIAFHPNSVVPVIGASGAVAGVLGAYVVLFPGARVLTLIFFFFFFRLVWLPSVVVLGLWFLLQLVEGLPTLGMVQGGGVAWFAHIGGFAAGALLVFMKRPRGRRRRPEWDGAYGEFG